MNKILMNKIWNKIKKVLNFIFKNFVVFYFYLIVRIVAYTYLLLRSIYIITIWKPVYIVIKFFFKYIIGMPCRFIKFCYDKIKLHVFEDFIFLVVKFIWVEYGTYQGMSYRDYFYEHMRWYHYVGFWEGITYNIPMFIFHDLIYVNYLTLKWKVRCCIWELGVFVRKIQRILKFFFLYFNNNNQGIKYGFFISVFISCIFLWFKFIYASINYFFIFYIEKRIDFFVNSNYRYFLAYLNFIKKYHSVRMFKIFNLCRRPTRIKMNYNQLYFYWNYFWRRKLFDKNKNIFFFYRFRENLWDFYQSNKRKLYLTGKIFNKLFRRGVNKKKVIRKKSRGIIYIKNMWLYSANSTLFYFYKTFFFLINFVYSGVIYLSDTYIHLLIWFSAF